MSHSIFVNLALFCLELAPKSAIFEAILLVLDDREILDTFGQFILGPFLADPKIRVWQPHTLSISNLVFIFRPCFRNNGDIIKHSGFYDECSGQKSDIFIIQYQDILKHKRCGFKEIFQFHFAKNPIKEFILITKKYDFFSKVTFLWSFDLGYLCSN